VLAQCALRAPQERLLAAVAVCAADGDALEAAGAAAPARGAAGRAVRAPRRPGCFETPWHAAPAVSWLGRPAAPPELLAATLSQAIRTSVAERGCCVASRALDCLRRLPCRDELGDGALAGGASRGEPASAALQGAQRYSDGLRGILDGSLRTLREAQRREGKKRQLGAAG